MSNHQDTHREGDRPEDDPVDTLANGGADREEIPYDGHLDAPIPEQKEKNPTVIGRFMRDDSPCTQDEMHYWADDNRPQVDEEKEIYRKLCLNTRTPNYAAGMPSHVAQQVREQGHDQGMER
jgi:hypothetical protein